MIERVWRDLRFALRIHAKTPVATAAIVGTLALGIAATAASFSITSAFFLRPLPIAQPDRFVRIYHHEEGSSAQYFPISPDDLRDIRELRHVFDDAVAEQPRPLTLGTAGSYERIWGEAVSNGYFRVLGVTPTAGRFFTAREEETGEPVVVLSDGLWNRRFGRDPQVFGQELRIDGRLFRVIGIAPEAFGGTLLAFASELWIPCAAVAGRPGDGECTGFSMGKLRAGATIDGARSALDELARRLELENPAAHQGGRFAAFLEADGRVPPPFHTATMGFSVLLLVMALLVTAVACANVAGVLLARAAARRAEIAIRLALGASRRRIVGQLLAEAVPLSVAAGGLGLLLAWQLMRLLSGIEVPLARGVELSVDLTIDRMVLGASVALTVLTGILFGLAPAIDASGARSMVALQAGTRRAGGGRRSWTHQLLLGGQVAVSMVLLASGAFFAQSLRHAQTIDLGFDPSRVVTTSVDIRMRAYGQAEAVRFWTRLVDEVRRLPHTEAASLTFRLPLELGVINMSLGPDGFQAGEERPWPTVEFSRVEPRYFETLRIPLIEGRDFDERDTLASTPAVIVNDTVARQFWPGAPAAGRRVVTPDGDRFEVVGVVRTSKYFSVGEDPKPYVYFPLRQGDASSMTVIARGRGDDPSSHLRAIAERIRALDPIAPLYEAGNLSGRVDTALAATKGAAAALGGISLMALALTSLGLFAAVAQAVSRRTYEIGVRRALGAPDGSVARLVTSDAMRAAAVGLACGIAFSLAAARGLRALLYDVHVVDPAALGGAGAVIIAVCLVAAAIPARRAVRMNAASALRHE